MVERLAFGEDSILRDSEAGDDHTDASLSGSAQKNFASQRFPFEKGPGLLV